MNYLFASVNVETMTEQQRILNCYAASGNHFCTTFKGYACIVIAFYPATEIDGERCLRGHCLKHTVIYNMVRDGSVEVDDVKPAASVVLELTRNINSRRIVFFFCRIVALRQPHAFASNYVDCRYYFCCHNDRNFLRISSPSLPLFSGWNCVAKKLSLFNMALNLPMYSVVVMVLAHTGA